jgi:hypothetical protein
MSERFPPRRGPIGIKRSGVFVADSYFRRFFRLAMIDLFPLAVLL